MNALDRKLLRDLRRLWAQALAIALVLACGVAILLTTFGTYGALEETRRAYYERNRFADVFAAARRAPLALMQDIRAIPGVRAAEPRISEFAILDVPGRIETVTARILSLPDEGAGLLNLPVLRAGRLPRADATDEVAVNAPFASANGLAPGDSFLANLNGHKRALTLTGTLLSPEFIYTIGPGAIMPDNETFGILWMAERALQAAYDMDGAFNNVTLALGPGTHEQEVIDRLDHLLEPYGGFGAYGRDTQTSNSFIEAELDQQKAAAVILPPVFYGIAAFLVAMVIGRIVALERSEIGLLKAIGYSNAAICLHYLMLAGLIAVAGTLIGWAVGTWLARALARLYAQFFDFPYLIYNVSYTAYALSGLLAIAAAALGAARSALRAARLAPAVAMAPPAPPRFRRTLLDRALAALDLSQPAMMILRSLMRWPMRSAMTALGLSLAVAVLVSAGFFFVGARHACRHHLRPRQPPGRDAAIRARHPRDRAGPGGAPAGRAARRGPAVPGRQAAPRPPRKGCLDRGPPSRRRSGPDHRHGRPCGRSSGAGDDAIGTPGLRTGGASRRYHRGRTAGRVQGNPPRPRRRHRDPVCRAWRLHGPRRAQPPAAAGPAHLGRQHGAGRGRPAAPLPGAQGHARAERTGAARQDAELVRGDDPPEPHHHDHDLPDRGGADHRWRGL
ncbi:MAG: FtsX-like permease family protein [Roseovarius sp.]|nr:FtsX-like permease family protein [Roseovarius sp.]